MTTHRRALLRDGRLHLQEGPSDLVIAAFGSQAELRQAYEAAEARFDGLLAGLVGELRLLRQPLAHQPPSLRGDTARRMARACWPFRSQYITPMAAVAGAVADTVLAAMVAAVPGLARAYVNNGGDIALHLARGESLDIGIVPSLQRARPEGFIRIAGAGVVRGVATSGWQGRSFSRGIADAVTVLARSAAEADAAASIIANAVTAEDPAIAQRPARSLDPDSDLGDLPVTVSVGPLPPETVALALERGALMAQRLRQDGLIEAALLALAGEWRAVDGGGGALSDLARPVG